MLLLLILLAITPAICQSSYDLSPVNLCAEYTSCKRDSMSMEDHCEYLESLEGKPKRRVEFVPDKNERVIEDTSICGVDLHPEYAKLRKHLARFRREVNRCIAESLIEVDEDSMNLVSNELRNYCYVSLTKNLTNLASISSSTECWKESRKSQRKCADLRRCCEPAMICEQKGSQSRNGRSIVLLREEIGYRLAECRSMRGGERHKVFHKLDSLRGNLSDEDRKKSIKKSIKITEEQKKISKTDEDKIVITMAARMPTDMKSLCSPYISCANDLFDYRLKCSAATGTPQPGTHYDFHLSYLQLTPFNEADEECREKWKESMEKAIDDQRKVGEFMAECVMHVKDEESKESMGCNIDVFFALSPPIISSHSSLNATCRVEEAARKSRCNELRSCCLPAQVCERSEIYETLAHEFIASSMDLRANMNACYKEKYAVMRRRR
ncbi:hypothetical protein PFISCL1PPCAC_6016 [Pristionchus fissidentatus]|uniref:Uncharacterized protein n=1 Tax=Pristionchus fissidentatus TaxID=1538716 RepID=A0AAV5V5L6_9BILA|nr:hypothetical protein PFISCL1PPCAC_6016 [Pristionchus fissidentatus]